MRILLALMIFAISLDSWSADTLRIVGVGDINLGTAYPSRDYLPPKDNSAPLIEPAKQFVKGADMAFCNLEGPFTEHPTPAKSCSNPSVCYIFRTPKSYFQTLLDLGFEMFSVANNHIFDFGEIGVKDTYELVDKAKKAAAGTLTRPYAVIEKNGVKYGFCAFSPNNRVCSLNDYKAAEKIVKHLASVADIVIVSFHGGAEGAKYTHLTRKREHFVGEDRGNPYEFARMVIDAGADVVFGHGPHVPRAVDLYKGRFIAYSLGNFCTYSRISVNGVNGYAPLVDLKIDKNGKFLSGQIVSFTQTARAGISLDATNKVAKLIKSLTETDIPESPLKISESGKISLK